ncbi:uncharacterized protein EHS24_003995 [Apiotrichum porosum]|uniref:D-arabinitol 2-dehydrogenase [ribulose-forming] n=1 Tax=Apiotrichum porosum TaxID=105984 RepID=A0A427Y415_9TREE|nr:uncharacterized protein EHS24_003995 [Apiotrichum porosum]RSH85815.1 hypothetical protein EHS24_003995 [Apiotrichum porosum]
MALRTLSSVPARAGGALPAVATAASSSARSVSSSAPRQTEAEHDQHRVRVAPNTAASNGSHKVEHKTAAAGGHSKRTLPSFSMDGKVCVVTGAGRGLGNEMARTLVQSGANELVVLDLVEEQAAAAAKEIEESFVSQGLAPPGEITAVGIGCDVANEESVKAAFQRIKDLFGRVDALVTAAGIVHNYTAEEYPTEKIRQLMDINVMGTWFCALEASKLMPNGGSIILIGSMSGSIVNIPQPQTPYNFSKSAVRHMGRSLAVEWAKRDIRVNVISPGYMCTALTKAVLATNPILDSAWHSAIPVGRMGDPADLGGAVVYLASDASRYTTGSEIVIDGGYTAV